MDFGAVTNLNSFVKLTFENPLKKMKQEQSNPLFQSLAAESADGSDDRLSAIIRKMQAGEELSAADLEYLKEKSPDTYTAAIKAAREREGYESALRRCKTKDEVRMLHLAKIAPLFSKAKDAKANNDLTSAQAALAEASALTAIFTRFTATRDYASKAPDRATLEKAIQAKKYVKEDKKMSIHGITNLNQYAAMKMTNQFQHQAGAAMKIKGTQSLNGAASGASSPAANSDLAARLSKIDMGQYEEVIQRFLSGESELENPGSGKPLTEDQITLRKFMREYRSTETRSIGQIAADMQQASKGFLEYWQANGNGGPPPARIIAPDGSFHIFNSKAERNEYMNNSTMNFLKDVMAAVNAGKTGGDSGKSGGIDIMC